MTTQTSLFQCTVFVVHWQFRAVSGLYRVVNKHEHGPSQLIPAAAACLADLIPYMNQSSNNSSSGHSSGSLAAQYMGSAVAPPAYGVQFMPQPLAAPSQMQSQPFNQGW